MGRADQDKFAVVKRDAMYVSVLLSTHGPLPENPAKDSTGLDEEEVLSVRRFYDRCGRACRRVCSNKKTPDNPTSLTLHTYRGSVASRRRPTKWVGLRTLQASCSATGLHTTIISNLPDQKVFRVGIATSPAGQRVETVTQCCFSIGKMPLQLKDKAGLGRRYSA